jgi:hypothetical protein
MAAAPALKVYTPEGEYIGAVKEVMGAAVLVGAYGEGSTVRMGHSKKMILWTQGVDGDAGESYDTAGEIMAQRAGLWAGSVIY